MKNKKLNYIYRLMINGIDYADLSSVAEAIMYNVGQCYPNERASKPHFFKTKNGYQAIVVLHSGKVIRRNIDVFSPIKYKSKKKLIIDQSSKSYGYDDDYDDDDFEDEEY